ncbi:MAG: ferrous iron transport protein A [Bdellovibrio sp.]|nr:ferrous iron transport protein A [Methylotenera sp.]
MTQVNNIKLNSLNPGQYGVIHAIHAEQALHQRLNAMGFRIGKKIELIRRASFNGPLHVRIGATDIILRGIDAARIQLIPS